MDGARRAVRSTNLKNELLKKLKREIEIERESRERSLCEIHKRKDGTRNRRRCYKGRVV